MRLSEPFTGTNFAEEIDEFDEATGVMDDEDEDTDDEEAGNASDTDDEDEEE